MHIRRIRGTFNAARNGILVLLASATALGQLALHDGGKAREALGLIPRHATISVANIGVEKDWYISKLGFDELSGPQPAGGNGKIKGTELEIPGYQIHLIQFEGSRRAEIPTPPFLAQGWIHVAFSVANIAKASEFLKTSGVNVQEIRGKDGIVGTLVLHDPEGNEIELFSR